MLGLETKTLKKVMKLGAKIRKLLRDKKKPEERGEGLEARG